MEQVDVDGTRIAVGLDPPHLVGHSFGMMVALSLFRRHPAVPASLALALVTMMRENVRPAAIRAAGHVGAETDLRPVLPTVDVPTLVLHGEADARSPLANAQALHAAIATSELVVDEEA